MFTDYRCTMPISENTKAKHSWLVSPSKLLQHFRLFLASEFSYFSAVLNFQDFDVIVEYPSQNKRHDDTDSLEDALTRPKIPSAFSKFRKGPVRITPPFPFVTRLFLLISEASNWQKLRQFIYRWQLERRNKRGPLQQEATVIGQHVTQSANSRS